MQHNQSHYQLMLLLPPEQRRNEQDAKHLMWVTPPFTLALLSNRESGDNLLLAYKVLLQALCIVETRGIEKQSANTLGKLGGCQLNMRLPGEGGFSHAHLNAELMNILQVGRFQTPIHYPSWNFSALLSSTLCWFVAQIMKTENWRCCCTSLHDVNVMQPDAEVFRHQCWLNACVLSHKEVKVCCVAADDQSPPDNPVSSQSGAKLSRLAATVVFPWAVCFAHEI